MRRHLIGLIALATFGVVLPVQPASTARAEPTPGQSAAADATAAAVGLPTGALAQVGADSWRSTDLYGGANWASPDEVSSYVDDRGRLVVVSHQGQVLQVETFAAVTMTRVSVQSIGLTGWPNWGGHYAGPDGHHYVLVGRGNPTEDDTLKVLAVRRYDANWGLVGIAYVTGARAGSIAGTYSPLDASAGDMHLVGNRLVVSIGRLLYAIDGVHHQSNLTVEVDVTTMTARVFDSFGGAAYSSHSFRQLVGTNNGTLVTVDHGDAYPRAIQLGVMRGYPTSRVVNTYKVFPFNGPVGANFTGATVNSMVSGPSGVVILGTSIQHPDAPSGPLGSWDERRNVFAIRADPATGGHSVNWLTAVSPTGATEPGEPRVAQLGTDRFAVLYRLTTGTTTQLVYRLINSAGQVLATRAFADMSLDAVADPVVHRSRIYWVGSNASDTTDADGQRPRYLYGLNVADLANPVLLSAADLAPPAGLYGVDAAGLLMYHAPAVGGGLRPPVQVGNGWGQMTYLAQVDDITGDGIGDLIARNAANDLYLYPGAGGGTLGTGRQIGSRWAAMDQIIPAGALAGGSTQYVVARNRLTGALWRYRLTASGLSAGVQIGSNWNGMKFMTSVGDYTGDGRSDVLAVRRSDGTLWRYLGTPTGTLGLGVRVGGGWGGFNLAFSPGDLTADGRKDLVGRRSDGNLFGYPNMVNRWGATVPLGQFGASRLLG